MTHSEWLQIVQRVHLLWPDRAWPKETIAEGFNVAGHLPAHQVNAAVDVLIAEREKFQPNISVLYSTALKVGDERFPEWSEVWREVQARVDELGVNAAPLIDEEGTVYGRTLGNPPADTWSSPMVAEFVRLVGWQEICECPLDDLRTMEAQSRNKWQDLVRRRSEDFALARLKVGSGLPGVDVARRRLAGQAQPLTVIDGTAQQLPHHATSSPASSGSSTGDVVEEMR